MRHIIVVVLAVFILQAYGQSDESKNESKQNSVEQSGSGQKDNSSSESNSDESGSAQKDNSSDESGSDQKDNSSEESNNDQNGSGQKDASEETEVDMPAEINEDGDNAVEPNKDEQSEGEIQPIPVEPEQNLPEDVQPDPAEIDPLDPTSGTIVIDINELLPLLNPWWLPLLGNHHHRPHGSHGHHDYRRRPWMQPGTYPGARIVDPAWGQPIRQDAPMESRWYRYPDRDMRRPEGKPYNPEIFMYGGGDETAPQDSMQVLPQEEPQVQPIDS